MTNARRKLNAASLNGLLIVSGLTAGLFGSWHLFLVTALLLFGTSLAAGDIRPRGRR